MSLNITLLVVTVLALLTGLALMVRAALRRSRNTAYLGLGLLLTAAVLSSLNVLTLRP